MLTFNLASIKPRERRDNGLFITLVPKVLYLALHLCEIWFFDHNWGCISIYLPFSYHFRSQSYKGMHRILPRGVKMLKCIFIYPPPPAPSFHPVTSKQPLHPKYWIHTPFMGFGIILRSKKTRFELSSQRVASHRHLKG